MPTRHEVINIFGRAIEPKTSKAQMSREAAILSWDTICLAKNEAQAIIEDEVLMRKRYPGGADYDTILGDVFRDSGFFDWEWECLTNELGELLGAINTEGVWKARVENFGWQEKDGETKFKSSEGEEFLRVLLPNCDCTFFIHVYVENESIGLAIQNFHHDSPTGREWYYAFPITETGEGR